MTEHYKEVLLGIGIETNDNDIQNLKNIIDQANAFGCSVNIYDIVNILFPHKLTPQESPKYYLE